MPTVPPSTAVEAPKGDAEPKSSFKLEELGVAGSVLAAVGGGLGVLGLVAFFGAAILWLRMGEMGLPRNDTVAIMPKSVLISTGASFLVPALLIALAFTMALYLLDAFASWVTRWWHLHKPIEQLSKAEDTLSSLELEREALQSTMETAKEKSDAAVAAHEHALVPEEAETDAKQKVRDLAGKITAADAAIVEAKESIAKRERLLNDKQGPLERRIQLTRKVIFVVLTISLFAGVSLIAFDHFLVSTSPGGEALRTWIVVLLTAFIAVVGLKTPGFGWVAVAAFLAVTVVIGTLTYYRTVDSVKIEPAALLRKHGGPIFGFYVAQTSDRVYLGTKPTGGETRLDSVPRDEVLALVVGKLQEPTAAEEHALAFARQLCLRAQERKPTGELVNDKEGGKAGEEVAAGCTADDVTHLEQAG